MKKTLLIVSMLALGSVATFAQSKKVNKEKSTTGVTVATTPSASDAAATNTTIQFDATTKDLGDIPQNIPAEAIYEFKNTGKEALVIQNVKPACGCTTPNYTSEPVAPGKTGYIKASYNAASPGAFNKSITVTSNAGTTILYIKGNVEQAPANSVPQNSTMMKK